MKNKAGGNEAGGHCWRVNDAKYKINSNSTFKKRYVCVEYSEVERVERGKPDRKLFPNCCRDRGGGAMCTYCSEIADLGSKYQRRSES